MSYPVAILAGGLATRLRPQTDALPKALLDVNGEPFIAHQLKLLAGRGIRDVVLCCGHLGHMIEEYVRGGERFGLRATYSYDGEPLLGTGGAIRRALPLLGERFFSLYGDSYLECDYDAVASAFEASGKLALMTVFRNEGAYDKSNVEFRDGAIVAYEKHLHTPFMRHIDYGLGTWRRKAFDDVPLDEPTDLAVVYRRLLAAGELAGYEVSRRFYEVGSTEGLEEFRKYRLKVTQ